jgi:tetratricopeptide (TPR) repeat protein
MRYFVSYSQVFGNKDERKRQSLRLDSYNILIQFLTRKNIPGNPISEEFASMKSYFESRDFTSVYFLAPFILNENQIVKDIMGVITTSGETNSFNKIKKDILDEVSTLKAGRSFLYSKRIKVKTADEYLDAYLKNPDSEDSIELDDPAELSILLENEKVGYAKGEIKLSILYLEHLLLNSETQSDVEEIINMAMMLLNSHPDNSALCMFIAKLYNNQYYQKKDKYSSYCNWLKKAADLKNQNAMCLLGLCYFLGLGIPKNEKSALKCWKDSASLDNDDALSLLGVYYLSKGDKAQAKPYLITSAANGNYQAMLLLDTDFDRV